MNHQTIKVFKSHVDAIIPQYQTTGSACFDLHACLPAGMEVQTSSGIASVKLKIGMNSDGTQLKETRLEEGKPGLSEQLWLEPGQRALIPTGLIFNIPKDHLIKLFVRSGVAWKQGLSLINSTGIIDYDYVEPVYVAMINNSSETQVIFHKDRIAQARLEESIQHLLSEVKTKPKAKSTREGGFGSTGS